MAAQQRRESQKFTPRKGKLIRANKKWTSARKETGRAKINTVNSITVQSPSAGPGIFVLGLTKKQVRSDTVFEMMRTPACPKLNKKKPINYHPSKNINTILHPRKRKISKKLKQRRKYLRWLLRQTQQDPLRAINLDGARRHSTHQTIEKLPAFWIVKNLRQVRYIAPNKGKQKETKERNHKNVTMP